jgi:hypothetical protein
MGIVLGKPENYKRGVTASAVRRIANEEYSALKKRNTRRNSPNTRRNTRNKEVEEDPDEMPEDVKDAMREMGLDPTDPKDVEEFIEKMQMGGKRKRRPRRR